MNYSQHPVDWILLAKAYEYYLSCGFTYKETPYAVPEEYHYGTKPHNNPSFVLDKGIFEKNPHELVASAEQGFIYQLLNNKIKQGEQLFSISPCFRFDTYNKLHQPWFMKLELFHFTDHTSNLVQMVDSAKKFLEIHIDSKVTVNKLSEDMIDLEINGIEVGSFGMRKIHHLTFIYGTGLALPRVSIAKQTKHDNF